MKSLTLIVAWARREVIGRDGALPWHEAEDLAHFKNTTMGHAILMGRKTYESIGHALPGRRNLVISRQSDYVAEGCEVFGSLEAAIEAAREMDGDPMVVGGAAIYAAALPYVTRMIVTFLDRDVEGDTFFPAYDPGDWRETTREVSESGELVFRTLERR